LLTVNFFLSVVKKAIEIIFDSLISDLANFLMENLHKVIRRYREDKGICRNKMSERLGMTLNGYGKIERGEVEVTISRLVEIAEILQILITHFFRQNEIPNERIILEKKKLDDMESPSSEMESTFDPFVYIEFLENRINYLKSQLSKFH